MTRVEGQCQNIFNICLTASSTKFFLFFLTKCVNISTAITYGVQMAMKVSVLDHRYAIGV